MPGIGELMDGAMQHAPQPILHCMDILFIFYQSVLNLKLNKITQSFDILIAHHIKG
jgi:hypothetical protein